MSRYLIPLIVTLVGGLIWWFSRTEELGRGSPGSPSDHSGEKSNPSAAFPEDVRYIGEGSPFEDYGKGSTKEDLEIIRLLVHTSQLIIKNFDEYFLPDNQAVVSFLRGKNRDRLAWLPAAHPFISGEGEFIDRWKTPIFFHRESGLEFSFRSAGPDQVMWTDDDVIVGRFGVGAGD